MKRELGFPLDCDILGHLATLPPEEERDKRLQLDQIEDDRGERLPEADVRTQLYVDTLEARSSDLFETGALS